MEYRSRSCKMAFSLFDMDGDGQVMSYDFDTFLRTWPLDVSPLHHQEGTIDLESFLQVFPSINMNACDKGALNLLKSMNADVCLQQPFACSVESLKYIIGQDGTQWNVISVRACKLPSTETTDIIDKVDLIWGGKIDFVSLLKFFKPSTMNPFSIVETPSELFGILDRDGDGFLSSTDFKRFVSVIGQDFSDQEIQGLLLDLDIEGDGQVGYLAFCRSMQETWNGCDDLMPSMLELNLDPTDYTDASSDEEV